MQQLTPQPMRLIDSYDDGHDTKHLTFELLGGNRRASVAVGQFFMLNLPGVGQAPFTYASLPDKKGRFMALIRKVGKLTAALCDLHPGQVLGYNGPLGIGWPVAKMLNQEVLIVAGGCGLAPLTAAIDNLIKMGQSGSTTVIYGAANRASQVLQQERQRWQAQLPMLETFVVDSAVDTLGTPTEHMSRFLAQHNRQPQIVLTCGPLAMMKSVAKMCQELVIDHDKIWLSLEKRMRCGVGLCGHCYLANELICVQGPTYRYDQFAKLENKTTAFARHDGLFRYC
ncbi:MAG: anaerobic sulfite reductase subunit B [Paraglaciecola sp.]|jgi:anaerobic sulfite reductase subunit B